jgi:hypothetical protein
MNWMDLLSFSSIYPEGPTGVILVHPTSGYNTSVEGQRRKRVPLPTRNDLQSTLATRP